MNALFFRITDISSQKSVLFAGIALLLTSCGTSPQHADYLTAVRIGTVAAYEEYLNKYSEVDPDRRAIERRLAKAKDTIEAYESYLARYPNDKEAWTIRVDLAKKRSEMEFSNAKAADLAVLLRKYRWAVRADFAPKLVQRTWVALPESDLDLASVESLYRTLMQLETRELLGYGMWDCAEGIDIVRTQKVGTSAPNSFAVTGLFTCFDDFLYYDRATWNGKQVGPVAIVRDTHSAKYFRLP